MRSARRGVADQRLAHQDGLRPVAGVVADVRGVADSGFGHHDGAGRYQACQCAEHGAVHVQGFEVAHVDADDPGTGGHGSLHLVSGVRLHQDVHAQLVAQGQEVAQLRHRPARPRSAGSGPRRAPGPPRSGRRRR